MTEEHDDDSTEDDDFMEIDWEVLQSAIDAMADAGLDLSDHESAREHLAVLLASLLRRIRVEEPEIEEEQITEMAAEVAGLAVQLAFEDEEVPSFEAREPLEDS
jgi:hypothetical protein